MSTTISNLPCEVLSHIIRMLPPEDLKTVMLVSKAWKEMAEEPKLWTWLVVNISTISDLKKLEFPRLGQIQTLRMRPSYHCESRWRQPENLKKLLQSLLAFPSIKKIHQIENFYFGSVEPDLLASVFGNLDELDMRFSRGLSQAQLEHVFSAIAEKVNPMKKLSLTGLSVAGLSPAVLAAAATNVKELELYDWSEDQMKALLREMVENDRPLLKLEIWCNIRDIHNIDPDLVGRGLNKVEEVVVVDGLSLELVTAVLKGVVDVEGTSKLKRLWLKMSQNHGKSLDGELVSRAEQKIGKFFC